MFIAFILHHITSRTMSSFFPTPPTPASPNAFSIFAQSPREAHAMYEDLCAVLRPASGAAPKPTSSPISSKFTLLTPSQSPHDTYATYHGHHGVLCPSNGYVCTRKSHSRKILDEGDLSYLAPQPLIYVRPYASSLRPPSY